MQQSFRWFGPKDPVRLAEIRQAGAEGVVSALHQAPPDRPWREADVAAYRAEIEAAGLSWLVVESIPVAESVKYGGRDRRAAIAQFKQSLAVVGRAGPKVVCYNFMPVLDWTRTDLAWPHPAGGRALRFDWTALAAYDLCGLARDGAEDDYTPELAAAARTLWAEMGEGRRAELERTIIAGLPGAEAGYGREDFRRALAAYAEVDADALRANLIDFLREVTPVAAEAGVRLALHPDDPPFGLFGLPRVVSRAEDYAALFEAVDLPENGMTLCAGSLGARADNDVVAIARRFAERIHFAHLRNVRIEDDGSFHEDEHLAGRSDMVALVDCLLQEEARRERAGLGKLIPMRPDHGHLLASDAERRSNPGYSYIGRLKGLAELRGVEAALRWRAA